MNKLIIFCCLAIIVMLVGCNEPGQEMTVSRPNIVVIYTDDQQFSNFLQEGKALLTPNLDSLARKSLRFSNAHVAFSLCSPSRAALLTGRYGSSNGVLELGSSINPAETTMAQLLKAEGYRTALVGKWHIDQSPASLGFDHYSYFRSNGAYYHRKVFRNQDTLRPPNHVDEFGVEESIRFLEMQASAGQPFFLFHCPQTPHMNGRLIWDAKDSTRQLYDPEKLPLPQNLLDDLTEKPEYLKNVRNRTQARKYGYPEEAAVQDHTRDYYAVITELDTFLGRLFRKIKKLGLSDNTYVFLMSDNGWMIGDHGFTSKVLPYQASTHVPFLVSGPGITSSDNNSLVSNLDIMPTILELVGVEPNGMDLHGKSLVPTFKDPTQDIGDWFIYEGLGSYGGTLPNLTVLTKEYRYIKTYKSTALKEVEYTELYHIITDPAEMTNLAAKDKYAGLRASFDEKIEQHIEVRLKNTSFARD